MGQTEEQQVVLTMTRGSAVGCLSQGSTYQMAMNLWT